MPDNIKAAVERQRELDRESEAATRNFAAARQRQKSFAELRDAGLHRQYQTGDMRYVPIAEAFPETPSQPEKPKNKGGRPRKVKVSE